MAGIPGIEELEGSELLILESLADGPKHGYLLTTDIETRHGRKLGPGTLYASLARLETRGMIRALEAEDRRRPYELTDAGASALAASLATMSRFSAGGIERLQARTS